MKIAYLLESTILRAILTPYSVFLVGPFTISVKKIEAALTAYRIASEKRKKLKLIRISPVDTRMEEDRLIKKPAHAYHINIPPEQVAQLFRSQNGILLSSSSPGEGFGLPALEAMACAVPTVLTSIPSYKNFSSPQDYAVFVPVDDPEAMAQALMELMDNRDKKKYLIKRGLDVAAQYSYEKVAEKMEILLKNE
ncbi:Glycosyl transferase, group 1 domain protein [Candidatus Magnetomorum sp. HK-1]|nr:Glycosyl transferase, group 1 domain protein [Candidatus Magnetomorum sp. HK-1]